LSSRSLTGKQAPEFRSLQGWLNSPPLTVCGLKGRVVLLEFWTFGCVNCVRTLPYMNQLHTNYAGDRFILVGVHTPEFEFEKVPEKVADAVKQFKIEYPVAIDNENATWKLYGNQYWPRQTLVDVNGRIRWEHVGEGDYDEMEDKVRELFKEAGGDLASGKKFELKHDKDSERQKKEPAPIAKNPSHSIVGTTIPFVFFNNPKGYPASAW
jgi:thiol-disulfide isomerase/thioredoxin